MNAALAGRRMLPEDAAAGFRMLVVDDDPTSRTLAGAALAGHVSLVREAENGRVAVERMEEEEFDLAIVDLEMPVLDGFGVVEWARAQARTRHLPIIIVTGRDDVVAIERAFALGATSFLCKPINWNVLRHQVRYVHRTAKLERAIRGEKARVEAEADFWRRSCATLASRIDAEARRLAEATADDREGLGPRAVQAFARLGAEMERIDLGERLFTTNVAAMPPMQRVPASLVVEQAIAAVSARLGAAAADRVAAIAPPALELSCEPALVAAALAEVIANAVAVSPAESPVEVEASARAGTQVRFRVSDKGPGIPEQAFAAGLDSFRGLSAAAAADNWRGLGLLLARRIVERHGGHFGISSELGAGAEVFLSFPAEPSATDHAA